MVSTDSLLDAHEVVVRARVEELRVEELRAEAARVAAALGAAELALEHVVITRATLALVLSGPAAVPVAGRGPAADAAPVVEQRISVPKRDAGLEERALPDGYRQLWTVLVKTPDGVRCKAAAVALGLEPVPVPKKVEGVREAAAPGAPGLGGGDDARRCSRPRPDDARRAVQHRGCAAGQAAGHDQGHRPADHGLVSVAAAFVVPHAPAA